MANLLKICKFLTTRTKILSLQSQKNTNFSLDFSKVKFLQFITQFLNHQQIKAHF
jgi:hypothetical protein